MQAIDGEIAAIYGEDLADAFSFRDAQESGIREVHGTVGIFFHEFADPRNIARVQGEELQRSAIDHFPERFLGLGKIGEQVHGFCERRPDRGQGFAETPECGRPR